MSDPDRTVSLFEDDSAVSDVIGFTLVFALVVATVGIVFVSGFGGLENARDNERVNNAERAFDVLADNMADIYRENAPSRKTEIKLADSQLQFGETTEFTVTVQNNLDASGNLIAYESDLRPIVFTANTGTEIVYEGGAVIRSDRGSATMRRVPPLFLDEEHSVVPYIVTRPQPGSSSALAGESTVLVRGVRTDIRSLLYQDETDTQVTLTIETTSDRAVVWQRYLNDEFDEWRAPSDTDWSAVDWDTPSDPPCTRTDLGGGRSEVVCTFEPDEFSLSATGIEVELAS